MATTIYYSYLVSPLGRLLATAEEPFLTGLYLPGHKGCPAPDAAWQRNDEPFASVRRQLAEYFTGDRTRFNVALKPLGTRFQQRVWHELVQIPFGTTITYAQLAQRIGRPSAARAVGHANSRNPISIIIPCHRVIGADGRLTGYAGGLDKKRWLLDWERRGTAAERGYLFEVVSEIDAGSAESVFSRSPSMVAKSGRS